MQRCDLAGSPHAIARAERAGAGRCAQAHRSLHCRSGLSSWLLQAGSITL